MENRLPNKVIYSYGLANLTFTMIMTFVASYYTFFLTDVVKVAVEHLLVIMSTGHLVNTVSMLLSGIIIQRTQMRWGKYRSWFLFMPIIACLLFPLIFANLPMSYSMKIVWLLSIYILFHLSINFPYTAHQSFISVSKNVTERLWLSARNTQFSVVGQVIFAAAIVPVVTRFNAGNGSRGFFYAALILAVVPLLGYWNLFHQTGDIEKYDPDINKPSNKMSIADIFTQIFRNSQLLLLMAADCMVFAGTFVVTALAVYYYKYVGGGDVGAYPLTFALGVAGLISYLIGPYIIIKFGKKKVYLFLVSLGILCLIFLRIFGVSYPYTFKGIFYAGGILTGLLTLMRQAMYMDISGFGFYKTGKDVTAYIMSVHIMSPNIGIAMATSAVPFGLYKLGYFPNMPVTDQFINGLMNMICYIPIACGVIALVAMSFYSLTDDKAAEIMEANSLKK
ncbi:MFS transporter [Thermodesulfobacteriota bacterium]